MLKFKNAEELINNQIRDKILNKFMGKKDIITINEKDYRINS